MPNLVKLYTKHGAMWVDANQLAGSRTQLSIYTRTGKRLIDTKRGEALHKSGRGTTVHRDNLFASKELADADYRRIVETIRRSA